MKEELKPCQFCGDAPVVEKWTIGCDNQECGVSVKAIGSDHATRAKQWNTRTPIEGDGP